ncbi:MAG: hypothetical protein HFH92_11005 [Lachnospiraceae bacterium]|jgi:hypothetical protein|uniref:hypothetical protein n=1 Tax=uncultured Acetatifactor sp. TaxID=1671927 RepID=UPI00260875A4|nr:hypothetical protein [uncultured Acetatifactor sp.]MCI8789621.1 hypothetical protein [Lachnospiraceae bacterium]
MRHIPIKLGPLALLLAVISICMTTLGILSFATARADWSLAETYADTVRIRYGLEARGQQFLSMAGEAVQGSAGLGGLPDTETDEEGVVWKVFTEGEYGLRVGVAPEEDGSLRVVSWRMEKEWEPDEDMNLWDGF